MSLASGSRLGPYEIVSPLGAGGMGEVYRARDTRLDRTVAIKVLPAHLARDPERRARFEREARAASALSHPHICTLYDVGQQDGIDFLVMEYLEGETLAGAAGARARCRSSRCCASAIEIADALDKAHRQGIVHRDLKPGNVMLTEVGGEAARLRAAPRRDAPRAAAEHLTRSRRSSRAADAARARSSARSSTWRPSSSRARRPTRGRDIFALGAVLYEMATGRGPSPARARRRSSARSSETSRRRSRRSQPMTPPALDRVVTACLAKDPDERWQTRARRRCASCSGSRRAARRRGCRRPSAARPREPRAAGVGGRAAAALLAAVSSGAAVPAAPRGAPRDPLFLLPPEKTSVRLTGDDAPAVLSPDGERVAFVRRPDGRQLWVRSLDAPARAAAAGHRGTPTFPSGRRTAASSASSPTGS